MVAEAGVARENHLPVACTWSVANPHRPAVEMLQYLLYFIIIIIIYLIVICSLRFVQTNVTGSKGLGALGSPPRLRWKMS